MPRHDGLDGAKRGQAYRSAMRPRGRAVGHHAGRELRPSRRRTDRAKPRCHCPVCAVRGLPRCAWPGAWPSGRTGAVARRRRRSIALVRGHRAGAGARPWAARRPRLHRQAHQPHQPPARQLVFRIRNFDHRRVGAGQTRAQPLWQVHELHQCLPDRGDLRAVPT